MSDTGNGATPMTLEQLAHAFEAENEANRARFSDFERRWGKLLADTTALQRSQRGVVDDFRDLLCRFDSYLLAEKTRRAEEAVLELARHDQLQAQIRASFAVARKKPRTRKVG